jgi:uncharacterized protein (DUF2336 family)
MPQNASELSGRLAVVPAGQRHSVIIRSLADLFSLLPEHPEEDLERFEALFRPLYKEAEVKDRMAVVRVLARRRDLPKSVISDFLSDNESIAATYLVEAANSDDTALLNLVARGTLEERLAIARHDHLSEPVVLALLVAGEDEVVLALADNMTARIPEHLIEELEAEAEAVTAADVRPSPEPEIIDIPAPPTHEPSKASGEFARFLELDDEMRFRFITGHVAESAMRRVETAGHAIRRQVPVTLFSLASAGDRDGLAREIARALDIVPDLARAVIDDKGGEPLAVALAAMGADNALAVSILLLTLPEETRSYWRLGALRDLHERMGWRGGAEVFDLWREKRPASHAVPHASQAVRQVEAAERPKAPVARPQRRILRPAELAGRRAG